MPVEQLPPEIEQHLVIAKIDSTGVSFESSNLNRWCIPTYYQYFADLQLDKTYYGKYHIVCYDGIDDGLYETLKPFGIPLLTIGKRVGQESVYLLPMPSLLDLNAYKLLETLRERDTPFLKKGRRMVWFGGLSGPLPLEENVRCRFVTGAPAILDRIGVPHDIKFTHLFDRADLYQPRFGRYEPSRVEPEQQLDERLLVVLDGNSYPGSLHWSLGVNSLVFRNESPWRCMLDELFFPGHDYLYFSSDLSDFEQQVQLALDKHREMEQLVVNSTMKMRAVTRELVDERMKATLRRIQDGGPAGLPMHWLRPEKTPRV